MGALLREMASRGQSLGSGGRRVFFFVNKKEAKKTFGVWAWGVFR
jgi:hypothetical protein